MNQKEIRIALNNFLQKEHKDGELDRCCILSGPWGVGKTYLIDKIIEENTSRKFAKISLFGINNVEDLKIRIVSELCKNARNVTKAIRLVLDSVSFSFGLGSAGSISINMGKLSELLEKIKFKRSLNRSEKNFVVILDDIERKDFKLTISEVLGTVDELLRNKNIKVILITNFDKIKLDNECNEFKDFKEKIAKHTYELNNVDEVVEKIIKEDKNYLTGKNLRTINQFKELLTYISSCSIDYPIIIKQIIYHILSIEKEKIDFYRCVYEFRKNKAHQFADKTLQEIEAQVHNLSRMEAISEYVFNYIDLVDNEKRYTVESVEKIIEYVYSSIYEGDDNRLLTIPKPEYGIFIDVVPLIPSQSDEKAILQCIDKYNLAFASNNINYSKTAFSYCDFIYNFYSVNSSNEIIKKSFDDSINNYIAIIVDKCLIKPDICVEVFRGISKAINKHRSNKFANKIEGNIKKLLYVQLSKGPYNDDSCFIEKTNLLNSFFDLSISLPNDFFSGFESKNPSFVAGIDYIFAKCEKPLNNAEWESFKVFFSILNKTSYRLAYKEYARTKLKASGTASERFKELIALIN